jgi:hypothetical protein
MRIFAIPAWVLIVLYAGAALAQVQKPEQAYVPPWDTVLVEEDGKTPLKQQPERPELVRAADGTIRLDSDGHAIKADPYCDKCTKKTLRMLVVEVLDHVRDPEDKTPSFSALQAQGDLAKRIRDEKNPTLTKDERDLIEKLVAIGYPSPIVLSEVGPMLDPTAEKPQIKK